MQYNNRRASSAARAVIKTTYAVLSMGIVVAFLGSDETLTQAGCVLVGLLCAAIAVTLAGGFYEIAMQGDGSFLDIMCTHVLKSKGQCQTYSITSGNVLSVSYVNLLIIHRLTIDYIGHNGKRKRAKVGLTLMSGRQREKLMRIVKTLRRAGSDKTT